MDDKPEDSFVQLIVLFFINCFLIVLFSYLFAPKSILQWIYDLNPWR